MRIAIIVQDYPKLSETFILQEFYQLGKLGVKGSILAFKKSDQGEKHPVFKKINFPVLYFPPKVLMRDNFYPLLLGFLKASFFSPAGMIKNLFWLLKAGDVASLRVFLKYLMVAEKIKELNPELLLSHFSTQPTIAAIFLANTTGIPFGSVLHTHDLFVKNRFLKEKLEQARFVVIKSNFSKQYLVENFLIDRSKIWVIPTGGIDCQFFSPSKVLGKQKKIKTILSIGRLIEKKGFVYLIKACAVLRKRDVDFQCFIMGDGVLKKELKKLIHKHKLGNQVKILNPLPHVARFKKILLSADVFVLPSIITSNNDRDILANTSLEAMASAIPVITTRISGIEELIVDGENGFLVPMKDSRALAKKVEMVLRLSKKERLKIGRKARMTIVKDFAAEKVTKRMFNLIKKMR